MIIKADQNWYAIFENRGKKYNLKVICWQENNSGEVIGLVPYKGSIQPANYFQSFVTYLDYCPVDSINAIGDETINF